MLFGAPDQPHGRTSLPFLMASRPLGVAWWAYRPGRHFTCRGAWTWHTRRWEGNFEYGGPFGCPRPQVARDGRPDRHHRHLRISEARGHRQVDPDPERQSAGPDTGQSV